MQIIYLAKVNNKGINNGAFDHLGNYFCLAKTSSGSTSYGFFKMDKDVLEVHEFAHYSSYTQCVRI